MSSLFKGVRKVFKKVIKAVKKIAVPALALGAIIFTGGAALGVGSMAGGWSAAASAIATKVAGSGFLGSVLTGAVTQAGYGALTGGLMSAVTGGSFTEGAKQGAKVGALTGGLLSGAQHLRNPTAVPNASGGVDVSGSVSPGPGGSVQTFPMPEAGSYAGGPTGSAAAGAVTRPSGGLLSRVGGFLKDNPEITGNIVKGIGSGILAGSEADAERDLIRARLDRIGENYSGTDPGLNYRTANASESGVSPGQRFDPRSYGSYEYKYNPQSGRIERTPIGG